MNCHGSKDRKKGKQQNKNWTSEKQTFNQKRELIGRISQEPSLRERGVKKRWLFLREAGFKDKSGLSKHEVRIRNTARNVNP